MPPGTVLLSGIVGSTAYGLATEDSDIDRLGTYAAPTAAFHGLHPPSGIELSERGRVPVSVIERYEAEHS